MANKGTLDQLAERMWEDKQGKVKLLFTYEDEHTLILDIHTNCDEEDCSAGCEVDSIKIVV